MAKTGLDHVISVVKAGTSMVPLVGGPLSSLIGDYIPSSTQRAIERTLHILTERLAELADRVDVVGVDKEEFAELFKSSYLVMMRAHSEDRQRAAANLIANILLRDGDAQRLSYTELDHFARALDMLSGGALRCVATVYRDVAVHTGRLERMNFEDLARKLADVEPDLLMGLVGELASQNLVHLPGAPGIPTADYGNYPIHRTTLGVKFVRQVLSWDPGTR